MTLCSIECDKTEAHELLVREIRPYVLPSTLYKYMHKSHAGEIICRLKKYYVEAICYCNTYVLHMTWYAVYSGTTKRIEVLEECGYFSFIYMCFFLFLHLKKNTGSRVAV